MRFNRFSKQSSTLALALAIGMGGALSVTVVATPVSAQKKDKDEKAPAADYSKGFVAVYKPLGDTLEKGEDVASIQAGIPALVAAAETPDDRNAAGSLIYSTGVKTANRELQLQGLDMMIASGKTAPDLASRYYQTAYQIADGLDRQDDVRRYLTAMADAGLSFDAKLVDGTSKTFDPDNIRILIADSYTKSGNDEQALDYLSGLIETRKAAGQDFPEIWVRRGFGIAYENNLDARVAQFSKLNVQHFPSDRSWQDAVAVLLNSGGYQGPETLDLLRLARRTDALQQSNQYLEYIEAADARLLPDEVLKLIDEGYASGKLDRSDPYVTESRAEATRRLVSDKKDLPELASDARSASADLKTLMAAGDAYLSYGRAAEAEEFYTSAQGKAGVNTPLVLTRLGIAQLDQGKYAEAEATFNKVQGARQAIASLWSVYTTQQSGS